MTFVSASILQQGFPFSLNLVGLLVKVDFFEADEHG
jgi:hypothetical protein